MYRAVGLAVLRAGVVLEDIGAVAEVAHRSTVSFDWSQRPPIVLLDGVPVAQLLRGPETTRAASLVAVVPDVREVLVREQQRIGERPNLVTEGRDQGTVVFPQAELKFFLDATPEERARRCAGQLKASGEADYDEILREIIIRDRRDAGRAVGPLAVPWPRRLSILRRCRPRSGDRVPRGVREGAAEGMINRSFTWKSLQVLARLWSTLMFDLKVYGRRYVPAHGGVLIVSNHQSYLDPMLLAVQLDRPFSYMAKSELFENRFFARFIRSLNAFPVRQGAGDKCGPGGNHPSPPERPRAEHLPRRKPLL